MKHTTKIKLIILIIASLLLLVTAPGCTHTIYEHTDVYIVEGKTTEYVSDSYKYKYEIDDGSDDNIIYFTDREFNVGDTIYLTNIKPRNHAK